MQHKQFIYSNDNSDLIKISVMMREIRGLNVQAKLQWKTWNEVRKVHRYDACQGPSDSKVRTF